MPQRPLQSVCSYKCANNYQKLLKENKEKKEWRDEKKVLKDKLKTHKDYLQILQSVFNTYIRMRDKGKLCICCDKPLTKTYHAGHFFSVGAYPNLRFDEDNVHAQREDCNLHKHGNIAEYAIMLPFRIGYHAFKALEEKREQINKISIVEIKELIIHYKQKIKQAA